MSIALDSLLGLVVLASLIGAVALVRLETPFEKLHTGSFIGAAGGIALMAAGFVADGVTDRSLKLVLIVVVLLIAGAAANHATARALHFREGERR